MKSKFPDSSLALMILFGPLILFAGVQQACTNLEGNRQLLLEDGFQAMPGGPLGSESGAETEYQYLPQARPVGEWALSTFRYNLPPSWYIRKDGGQRYLFQAKRNPDRHWHPMVAAGSPFWKDYLLEVQLIPDSSGRRSGVAFRYQHDRSYYFFGLENDSARLLLIDNATAYHRPCEKLLDGIPFQVLSRAKLELSIRTEGSAIMAAVGDENNRVELHATDGTFSRGKIALLADGPASFYSVRVSTDQEGYREFLAAVEREKEVSDSLAAANPVPVVYRKITTEGFGTGRNIRFGDLDGDGEIDVLIGQDIHHGPKDRNSELSCLTAMTLEGKILWQKGRPDPWKTRLTNDVAFQIHDLDKDGRNEVIYCMNQELVVADGKSGKVLRKVPTPPSPRDGLPGPEYNIFPRILGDCLYFADLSGAGFDGDLLLKDRYSHLWAYSRNLEPLWEGTCKTGHYPYAYDTDGDGRDEILTGYTLFDDDGKKIWSLDSELQDHADGVAIVKLREGEAPVYLCAASDEGMFFADLAGHILKHHFIGHVQNPAVANFRDDLEGLETVSVNFWGNQGIITLYNSSGEIYRSFEPCQYGSMCLPLNWTGRSEEYFVLNANVDEGGAWDGYGRRVFAFPDDGHPDMCYAVLDITGDCRDEIVVWDPHELWVYTQDDNSVPGRLTGTVNSEGHPPGELYHPVRNPLYNYSNYQATVSRPAGR